MASPQCPSQFVSGRTPDSNAPECLVDGVRSQANLDLIDCQVGDMSASLTLYESIFLCVLGSTLFCLRKFLQFGAACPAYLCDDKNIYGLHMLRLGQAFTPLYALLDITLCPKKLSPLIPYRS